MSKPWWLPLFFALTCACGGSMPESRPHPLLTKSPKALEEPSLEGELVKFPAAGRVTLIDFWSTVCEPCLKMMPEIEGMHRAHRAQGLTVIGIAVDDNPGLVSERLKKLGVTYTNVLDSAGSSRGAYQVDELPQTFVFDKKGALRFVAKGGSADDVATIRAAVEYLLTE